MLIETIVCVVYVYNKEELIDSLLQILKLQHNVTILRSALVVFKGIYYLCLTTHLLLLVYTIPGKDDEGDMTFDPACKLCMIIVVV